MKIVRKKMKLKDINQFLKKYSEKYSVISKNKDGIYKCYCFDCDSIFLTNADDLLNNKHICNLTKENENA